MSTQGPNAKLTSESEWLDDIATASQTDRSAVEDTLRRHGIRAQATAPRARKVAFTSISFSGVKEEVTGRSPFHFDWQDLGTGLWAVMSEVNSRGKSSVLNILKAALQGEFPNDIKPDVWRWLSRIVVDLRVDQIEYQISVEKESGNQSSSGTARLSRRSDTEWTVLYDGLLSGLKGHVETLFMEELGFAKLHAVNEAGTPYEHSWPAVAGALSIGGNAESKALFGELLIDGLPLRLLQLFIGMPWVSTLTAITAAKKILAPAARPASDPLAGVRASLRRVEEDLASIGGKSSSAAERADLRRRTSSLDAQLAEKLSEIGVARQTLQQLLEHHDRIRTEKLTQARLVQELKDERDASYVFRNLRPERCPACEADFHVHLAPPNDEHCLLCKSALPFTEDEQQDARLQEAEKDLKDISSAFRLVATDVAAARDHLKELDTTRDALVSELDAAQITLSEKSDDVELRFAELDATARTLKALLGDSSDAPSPLDLRDKVVLDAAEKRTRAVIDGLQTEILRDVGDAIERLSTRFGVRNLTQATLNSQGHLKLIQGAADTSFSRLTKGERLRVKIAAALAAVEVARARGLGRHPGLLLLDSPGAEEVIDADFHEMLANVSRVAHEMGGVQVFIGTIYRPELDDVVPLSHRRHARGEASLF
ncbi:hypothetical protein [Caballeronia sp. S22]|uniref:hypothetical protein n=1 Tax=Caballeronia sp. S22 TaxID=3137182 RepID=UPI0035305FBA